MNRKFKVGDHVRVQYEGEDDVLTGVIDYVFSANGELYPYNIVSDVPNCSCGYTAENEILGLVDEVEVENIPEDWENM